eukprot:SAG11_NODE_3349_length_2507_cov_3.697674_4_plen_109_part_01
MCHAPVLGDAGGTEELLIFGSDKYDRTKAKQIIEDRLDDHDRMRSRTRLGAMRTAIAVPVVLAVALGVYVKFVAELPTIQNLALGALLSFVCDIVPAPLIADRLPLQES